MGGGGGGGGGGGASTSLAVGAVSSLHFRIRHESKPETTRASSIFQLVFHYCPCPLVSLVYRHSMTEEGGGGGALS